MTTELTKAAQQAHTPEHIAGVDHAHELLRRQGYHRDGDYFINVNRRGAEAIHVLTISLIVHAGQLCALTQRPAAQAEAPADPRIRIDFKQATELLEMFNGLPAEIVLQTGDGHSGRGLYAWWDADPSAGAMYLGQTNEEAEPEARAPQQATPLPFSVVADPSIAPGEAVVKLGGDEVGRIVNIDAQQATPDPVQPFLVRDVAALLGASVPDVCKALAHLGHGQRSTNMEIKPEEALAVAEHIRAAAAKPEPAGDVVAWCPALNYPGYERERAWANGRPRQEDIDYWQATGVGITYAYDRTAPGVPDGWAVSAYKAAGLTIQSMAQLEGPDLWKIADATGNVLNKQGEWEWEPMPSSRDDAFLARCRYATLAEASAALAAAQAKGADHD